MRRAAGGGAGATTTKCEITEISRIFGPFPFIPPFRGRVLPPSPPARQRQNAFLRPAGKNASPQTGGKR